MATVRNARLLQLLGLVLALVGLVGFWLDRRPEAVIRSESEIRLMNPNAEAFHASFVVAGRDVDYDEAAGGVIRNADGVVVGRTRAASGARNAVTTDSIFFVSVAGDHVRWIGLPRDIFLDAHGTKINSIYQIAGADGLRQAVSRLLNLPVDFHVVVDMEVFRRVVDALGGVHVTVTSPMRYSDHAAGLHIDFSVGRHHLMGEDAASFVRFRSGTGNDLGRIDNLKHLGAAMLARAKELHLRAALLLPELIDIALNDVETNIDLQIATQLAQRLPDLQLDAATVPVREVERTLRDRNLGDIPTRALALDERDVERFLADFFGGEAREVLSVPEVRLLVTDRSEVEGLGERLAERLVRAGVQESHIATRVALPDGLPTRVQLAGDGWAAADFFADLLHVSRSQVFRLDTHAGVRTDVEIVVGDDAAAYWGLQPWRAVASE